MTLEEYCEIIQNAHPVLKYCERFDQDSSKWDYTVHSHPYIELLFFIEGKLNLNVAGTKLSASMYDTVVYPAGCVHQDAKNLEMKCEIFCFWIDIPELVIEEPILMHENSQGVRNLFVSIYEEEHRKKKNRYLIENAVKSLLMMILRDQSEMPEGEQFLSQILHYIDRHYTQRITLEDLAAMSHISKSYLTRRFRQYTGTSVISYINQLRVSAARDMLVKSDKNIMEIAWELGFESPKYFHRVFKKETGHSPAAYRKSNRDRRMRQTDSLLEAAEGGSGRAAEERSAGGDG